ncbi:MAG TPA: serine hydrolase, partial [Saprospiraceae bacterium]|nr:serine hydrolase [Saprospiraceae bacterium]
IVYEKSFGHFTYDDKEPVYLHDLYDIASVTKVAATTPTVMRLYKEGMIDIHKTLGDYLPWLRGSNKQHMVIDRVMAHQAGLQSWIPFFQKTIRAYDDGSLQMEPDVYCDEPSLQYCVPVAHGLYLDNTYVDSIHRQIYISPLNNDGSYVYSDLGFIMLAEIIKNLTGVSLDHYVDSVFYTPMGLHRIGYKPLQRFLPDEIVPSEIDTYFRCQVLRGFVHDMGCAMLGGVSGHAGVFTDAEDLAIMFQMYMNGGSYGGRDYLDPDIIKLFTTRYHNGTRRGLGFDMKELEPGKKVLTAHEASDATYGHTGFTGTCVWNDPEHQLIYVFLSNRTYPTMRNNGLQNHAIRERIHSRAYKAIEGFKGYTIEAIQG